MKRFIVLILSVLFVFSFVENSVYASDDFDKSAFVNSSKFQRKDDFWSLAGGFNGKSYPRITVASYLSSTYVKEGWGPELRIQYRNPQNKFEEVIAFRAKINGKDFSFSNLSYNDHQYIQGGYLFGGRVQEAFMKELLELKTASFYVDYKDENGKISTVGIDHVHTGELSDLVGMAKYLINSNAFSTDLTPDENDAFYGASAE